MSSENHDLRPEVPGKVEPDSTAPRSDAEPPRPLSATSSSGDELSASLREVDPDPMLGVVESPQRKPAVAREAGDEGHEAQRADVMRSLAELELSATDVARVPVSAGLNRAATDALASIEVSGSMFLRPGTDAPSSEHPSLARAEAAGSRRTPLGVLLLASYASAVTFALFWVLLSGRKLKESPEAEPPAIVDARPDPGKRAENSRILEAPLVLAPDHVIGIGQSIKLGLLEVTAVGMTSGPVRLQRRFNRQERMSGGARAYKLLLRLHNVSADTIFAPLDEAFVRGRIRAEPDSFIETGKGRPPIPTYPLAIESEWSIIGQEFQELEPDGSLETLVVSAPNAIELASDEMTWHIRLRTGLKETETLGVRFREQDVPEEP